MAFGPHACPPRPAPSVALVDHSAALVYAPPMDNTQLTARDGTWFLFGDWQGMTRHYYAITFGERYIWGVTAGILRNLYDRIYR